MKNLALSIGVLFLAFAGLKNTALAQSTGGPQIKFEKDVHDYGNIKQHSNGSCEFKFTNTGNAPLVISNAQGSCGCTVPDWPKDPIKPGASAVIKVNYDTKRVGPINKQVTVTCNDPDNPTVILKIKGNVEQVEDAGMPVKEDNMLKTK
jgi:hypothetical protein